MKKVVCFLLSTLLLVSSVLPAAAQRTKAAIKTLSTLRQPKNEATFASLQAFSDGRGVWVEWAMAAERNNLGFVVYRVGAKGGEVQQVSNFITGALRTDDATVSGREYNTFVPVGDYRSVYVVDSWLADGSKVSSHPVAVQYINDLTPVAGATSAELIERAATANPVVEGSRLDLPKDLRKEVASYAAEADSATQRSIVSKPGIKITIKNEGFYRITREELQAGGFDVNTNPDSWQLYVEGVQQAIAIGPNASYIEFYGVGNDTPEVDYRVYFLISGDGPGKRISSRSSRLSTSTVVSTGYLQTFYKKDKTNFLDLVINGESENFFGTLVFPTQTSATFTLSDIDFTAPTATVSLKLQGYSSTIHNWTVSLNNQPIAVPAWFGKDSTTVNLTLPTSVLTEGTNTLLFQSIAAGDTGFFDSILIGFARKFSATGNQISFYTDNNRLARIAGFSTSSVRVFDLTDKNNPIQVTNLSVTPAGAGYGVAIPAGRPRVYFGVEDSALLKPAAIVANNPALVADSPGADLIIIAYKDFLPQAETWANYRRSQGFTVNVVDVAEIYDEFGYGALGWRSVKDFLAYAYNNWPKQPKYVLLIGDGSYDPRNYLGRGFQDYVPVHIVDTIYTETASDDSLADFDNDGNTEMAIGRVATGNPAAITTVFNKTVAWENSLTPTSIQRGALLAYDAPIGWDFQATSEKIKNVLPVDMPSTLVDRSATDSGTTLLTEMNKGKFVVNYAGHGSTNAWATPNPLFFNSSVVPNLTNANATSIYTSLSCLNGYFHNPTNNNSLAEALTNSANGGAVAVWASSGETTPDVQEIMGLRFFSQLGAGNIPRLGDLIKDAKLSLSGGLDVKLSWVLIGDPMLKVR